VWKFVTYMTKRVLYCFIRNTATNFVKHSLIRRTARNAGSRVVTSELAKIMKPETPRRLSLESVFTPEMSDLENVFRRHGYELRIAGGAVRDLLSEKIPSDLDFATTATPEQMNNMFEEENIRMINKRGEQHGTVTCRINDKVALNVLFSVISLNTCI